MDIHQESNNHHDELEEMNEGQEHWKTSKKENKKTVTKVSLCLVELVSLLEESSDRTSMWLCIPEGLLKTFSCM